MANQVKTTFTVDAAQALRTIKEYQGRLEAIAKLESQLGTRGPNKAASVSQSSGGAARGVDAEMKAAQREIAKFEKERERMAREANKAIEREAKQTAAIQKREAKQAADTMISELKRVEGQTRGGKGGFWDQLGGAMGMPVAKMAAVAAGVTAVGLAVKQAASYVQEFVDRTVAIERANRLLGSSAKEVGSSYGAMLLQNKEFAKLTGVSDVQSAQTMAMIARLAGNAGIRDPKEISRLATTFANLGAARGISGQNLQDLMGTILSGQDEGLNRLGIADPGQLQKVYAEKLGKKASDLTQQEKVMAAVIALFEKGALYVGAAEQRMNSFEGSVVKTTKAWEDFSNAISNSFVNNPKFVRALELATAALSTGTPNPTALQEKIAKGEPITGLDKFKMSLPSVGEIIFGAVSGAVTRAALGATVGGPVGAIGGAAVGITSGITGLIERYYAGNLSVEEAKAIKYSEDFKKNPQYISWKAAQDANKPENQQEATKEEAKRQLAEAELMYKTLSAQDESYWKIREAHANSYLAKNKQEELAQLKQLQTLNLQALEQQYQRAQDYRKQLAETAAQLEASGNPEAPNAQKAVAEQDINLTKMQTELEVQRIEALKEQARLQKEITEKRKQDLREIRSIILDGFKDNPFVSIFDSAYQSLLKLREASKEFGGEFRAMAEASIRRSAENAYQQTIIDSTLKSYGLRSEAVDFRSGINTDTLTSEQQRKRQLNSLYGQLQAIGAYGAPTGFYSLSINPNDSPDAIALKYQRWQDAARMYRQSESKDRAIIDLTKGVNPSQLDPETRRIAAEARDREAKRLADQEKEARALFQNLNKVITAEGIKVLMGDGEQVVRIINDAPENATVTKRPSQASTNARYK